MIIEYEQYINAPIKETRAVPVLQVEMAINKNTRFQQFLARNLRITNKKAHLSLQNALTDHIWENYGNNNNNNNNNNNVFLNLLFICNLLLGCNILLINIVYNIFVVIKVLCFYLLFV